MERGFNIIAHFSANLLMALIKFTLVFRCRLDSRYAIERNNKHYMRSITVFANLKGTPKEFYQSDQDSLFLSSHHLLLSFITDAQWSYQQF